MTTKGKRKTSIVGVILVAILIVTGIGSGVSQVFQTSTPVPTLTMLAAPTNTEIPQAFGPEPLGEPEVYCVVEGYVELHNHQIADIVGPDGTTIVATIQRQEDELWLWTIVDETMTTLKVDFADDMIPHTGEIIIGIPINETTLMELSFDIVICGQHIYVPGMEYEPIKTNEI